MIDLLFLVAIPPMDGRRAKQKQTNALKLICVFLVFHGLWIMCSWAQNDGALPPLPGPGTAPATNLGAQDPPMRRPIDLMSPRIQSDGVSMYIGKKLYRHCRIVNVSADGNIVDFESDNGRCFVEWNKLPWDIQNKLSDKYDKFHQKALDEDVRQTAIAEKNKKIIELKLQKARDAVQGIDWFVEWTVESVTKDGFILVDPNAKMRMLLVNCPDSYVDHDIVKVFKAKEMGIYQYPAVSGSLSTVRKYQFVSYIE